MSVWWKQRSFFEKPHRKTPFIYIYFSLGRVALVPVPPSLTNTNISVFIGGTWKSASAVVREIKISVGVWICQGTNICKVESVAVWLQIRITIDSHSWKWITSELQFLLVVIYILNLYISFTLVFLFVNGCESLFLWKSISIIVYGLKYELMWVCQGCILYNW